MSRPEIEYRPKEEKGNFLMADGQSRVLIVDDDESFRTTLAVLLQSRGYVVESAEDGADALQKLRRGFRANLLVTDLDMPVMDGWQLRNELLQDESLAHLPVVVLSASKSGDACRTALQAADYLEKPTSIETLCALLERHCRSK